MDNSSDSFGSPKSIRIFRIVALILVFVMFGVFAFYAWVVVQGGSLAFNIPEGTGTYTQPAIETPSRTPSATQPPTADNSAPPSTVVPQAPIYFAPLERGTIVMGMVEEGHSHIFAYQEGGTLLRLTNGPWQDIQPSISQYATRMAFASNRDGRWELYMMDLVTGQIQRLTYTNHYEGSPSLSPDGLWMAYESLVGGDGYSDANLEIFIRPIDGSEDPIRLTTNPAADYAPAWSPEGRKIAFLSTRSGDSEVWIADLDKSKDRFQNVSQNKSSVEAHPAWSPDGSRLSWASSTDNDIQIIKTYDLGNSPNRPKLLNTGDWSAWSPFGDSILVTMKYPNQAYLTSYSLRDSTLSLPALALPGNVTGLSWAAAQLPNPLPESIQASARLTPTPNWEPTLTPGADLPNSRQRLVVLPEMGSEQFMLQDRVDDSFNALRKRLAQETGWDLLSNLEAAFVPLTAPLGPGHYEDWLFTGRAFSFSSSPYSAGWLKIVREDFGGKTYWRVYLRTRYQDGTQGQPLKTFPWDFNARHGNPVAYENGGAPEETIPTGYWLDFTELAAAYGWERQPAMNTWKLAFSSTLFNKFVLAEGRDWFSAMQEIYPRAALNTYTPVPSPTDTPTITLSPTPSLTPTRTPWLSRTPTLTRTPWPTRTPRISLTPTRTIIPSQTPTPTLIPSYTPRP